MQHNTLLGNCIKRFTRSVQHNTALGNGIKCFSRAMQHNTALGNYIKCFPRTVQQNIALGTALKCFIPDTPLESNIGTVHMHFTLSLRHAPCFTVYTALKSPTECNAPRLCEMVTVPVGGHSTGRPSPFYSTRGIWLACSFSSCHQAEIRSCLEALHT